MQFCNDLQHNRPTNGVLTQKIYAAKFEIQTNMFKMLDNVKQQIVKQLQRQEKQEVEGNVKESRIFRVNHNGIFN